MTYIEENTFAAACMENSITELQEALAGPADKTDMKEWDLTPAEWRGSVKLALEAKSK